MPASPPRLAPDHGTISPSPVSPAASTASSAAVDATYTLRTAVTTIANDACDTEIQKLCRSVIPFMSDDADAADLVPLLATACAKTFSRYRLVDCIQPGDQFKAFLLKNATPRYRMSSHRKFLRRTSNTVDDFCNAIETYLGGDEDLRTAFDATFVPLQRKYLAAESIVVHP